jgi:hypothetical protein
MFKPCPDDFIGFFEGAKNGSDSASPAAAAARPPIGKIDRTGKFE